MRNFIAGAITATVIGLLIVGFAGCGYQRVLAPAATVLPPIAKECSQTVESKFVELVNYAAAGDDWKTGLGNLAIQTSLCAVRVAAQQLIAEYAGIKMEPGNVDVPGRLKTWLSEHPNN
jgi:hypothetical protein